MSPEILLLLIVFILFPLIQQVLNALRHQRTSDQRTEQPTRAEEPEPRPASPRVPQVAHGKPASHGFTVPLQAAAAALPSSPVHPSARRHAAVAGLRNSRGLRRSIVLMTILGPCRATDPYA